jgi:hypothetical protein
MNKTTIFSLFGVNNIVTPDDNDFEKANHRTSNIMLTFGKLQLLIEQLITNQSELKSVNMPDINEVRPFLRNVLEFGIEHKSREYVKAFTIEYIVNNGVFTGHKYINPVTGETTVQMLNRGILYNLSEKYDNSFKLRYQDLAEYALPQALNMVTSLKGEKYSGIGLSVGFEEDEDNESDVKTDYMFATYKNGIADGLFLYLLNVESLPNYNNDRTAFAVFGLNRNGRTVAAITIKCVDSEWSIVSYRKFDSMGYLINALVYEHAYTYKADTFGFNLPNNYIYTRDYSGGLAEAFRGEKFVVLYTYRGPYQSSVMLLQSSDDISKSFFGKPLLILLMYDNRYGKMKQLKFPSSINDQYRIF